MPKLVCQKMGITEGQDLLIVDRPIESTANLKLPVEAYVDESSCDSYDHIILYRIYLDDLEQDFLKFKNLLKQKGKLWASWPKAKKLSTD